MKQAIKSTLAVAAGVASLASNIVAPSLVSAWGDSSGEQGRPSYTIDEINNGALGDTIVFNSISDGVLGDEKNFVSARPEDGDQNSYQANDITVEDGKTYVVRLYVHNNNPGKEAATAENVRVAFALPELNTYAKHHQINGFITSSNATPNSYWDYINFTSDKAFKLTYISGSAEINNNTYADKYAKASDKQLSDNIIKSETNQDGVLIGSAQAGDGKIPGCFEYDQVITIKVKAEYPSYMVQKQVRLVGEKEWKYNVDAKIGDKVEFQIQYKNLDKNGNRQENVMIRDILPAGLRYVPGTIKLYNANHKDGLAALDDNLFNQGINIGTYGKNSNGYIRFTAEVVDEQLECGLNTLVNWGKGTVNNEALTDYATVMTNKVCEKTPEELPKTGPESIVGGVITTGAIVTVAGYYIASRRSLR